MAGLLVKLCYWLAPGATNVDRTKCERVVPMEILVLGLSRTGTSSMRAGLKQLGYHDVYHMSAPMAESPRDAEMWIPAYRAKYQGQGKLYGREEWDKLLGHCMAISDVPCIHFGADLIEAYPEAKVILTVRDSPEVWLKSVKSTLIPVTMKNMQLLKGVNMSPWDRFRRFFSPRMPFEGLMEEMLVMSGKAESQALKEFGRTTTMEYTSHCDRIRASVAERNARLVAEGRADKVTELLEFNVKSGWGPLCDYLGKPVPTGEDGQPVPFPRLNDTKEFLHTSRVVRRIMDFLILFNLCLTGAGIWAAYKILQVYGPVARTQLGF